MTTEEISKTDRGVPKEEFLATLPPEDRENLTLLSESFERTMLSFNRKGALIAVGGVLNKPHPRKDIDILLVLEKEANDSVRLPLDTQLSLANRGYRTFKNLILRVVREAPGLKILSEIPPTIDEEYGSPNILKNDGSITITGGKGLPIELIRDPKGNTQERIASQTSRFSILAKI